MSSGSLSLHCEVGDDVIYSYKTCGDAKYVSQNPSIQSTLSHTITIPVYTIGVRSLYVSPFFHPREYSACGIMYGISSFRDLL